MGGQQKKINWIEKGIDEELCLFAVLGAEEQASKPVPFPNERDYGGRHGEYRSTT
jgi:hypothetical protein